MAEISEAIAMIKKAESDAEQLILDSESKSVDMINESKINAENIINEAKKAAEEDRSRRLYAGGGAGKRAAHHDCRGGGHRAHRLRDDFLSEGISLPGAGQRSL